MEDETGRQKQSLVEMAIYCRICPLASIVETNKPHLFLKEIHTYFAQNPESTT